MPHCIIEYSQGIENTHRPETLIGAVQRGAIASGLFEADHVRVRAVAYSNGISGYGAEHFVHVTLRILSGRDRAQKRALSERVLDELGQLGLASVSLTVEVADMDRETYAKRIL